MLPSIDDFFTAVTAKWEKGKVNHPKDPGGVTNDGVATHFITDLAKSPKGSRFLQSIGIEPRFIMGYLNKEAKQKTEIFDPELLLSFTPEQCRKILIFAFWERSCLFEVPCKLSAYATFDFCVNSGEKRGKLYLQMSANDFDGGDPLIVDGIIGKNSLNRLHQFTEVKDDLALAMRICERRLYYLKNLKTWPNFGAGWTNRVNDLKKYLTKAANHA